MNQSKKIEFSKSTFISLKAELLRKQDEVNKAKLDSKNQIEHFVPSSNFAKDKEDHKSKRQPSNVPDAEDSEILRKSKEKLEKKSLLYDHLSQSTSTAGRSDEYLVNFDKKHKSDSVTEDLPHVEPNQDDNDDNSDEEWVDYVDCLGRTRRCHKTDLEHTKKQDEALNLKINGPLINAEAVLKKPWVKEGEQPEREFQAYDPFKEQLRRQWEQKEEEIMKKDKVHYEDVLFNEARSHGVGYYALSGDSAERAKQQAELAAARADTERARVAAAAARGRREDALQARVKAARARQRARAGLPPEEEPDSKSVVTTMLLDFVEEQKRVSIEKVAEEARKQREAKETEAKKERDKFIREWDVGKEQEQEQPYNRHVELTQEQWVDKRRQERDQEFAPPVATSSRASNPEKSKTFDAKGFYFDTTATGGTSKSPSKTLTWDDVRKPNQFDFPSSSYSDQSDRSLFFTTKQNNIEAIKNKYINPSVKKPESFQSKPIRNECSDEEDDTDDNSRNVAREDSRKRGAEIEPPSTYEYFGPADKKGRKDAQKINVNEAFEKGVKYLEEQAASKDKRKNKRFLDEM